VKADLIRKRGILGLTNLRRAQAKGSLLEHMDWREMSVKTMTLMHRVSLNGRKTTKNFKMMTLRVKKQSQRYLLRYVGGRNFRNKGLIIVIIRKC